MSIIIFQARVVPISADQVHKIQSMLFKFLWHPNKIEAIGRKTLLKDRHIGGFNMIDVRSKLDACQLEKLKDLAN